VIDLSKELQLSKFERVYTKSNAARAAPPRIGAAVMAGAKPEDEEDEPPPAAELALEAPDEAPEPAAEVPDPAAPEPDARAPVIVDVAMALPPEEMVVTTAPVDEPEPPALAPAVPLPPLPPLPPPIAV